MWRVDDDGVQSLSPERDDGLVCLDHSRIGWRGTLWPASCLVAQA
jgi:hypothetical protein